MHIFSTIAWRKLKLYDQNFMPLSMLSVSTCHTRTVPRNPGQLATGHSTITITTGPSPLRMSNRHAWESCLSDKHHVRSPRFQCALITIIKQMPDPDPGIPMPGNLAFTSVTIADAREVFEIVIEKQLMVLYAMKIYCKHINERDMGIFWCQLRTEAAVSGELGLEDNSTQ